MRRALSLAKVALTLGTRHSGDTTHLSAKGKQAKATPNDNGSKDRYRREDLGLHMVHAGDITVLEDVEGR